MPSSVLHGDSFGVQSSTTPESKKTAGHGEFDAKKALKECGNLSDGTAAGCAHVQDPAFTSAHAEPRAALQTGHRSTEPTAARMPPPTPSAPRAAPTRGRRATRRRRAEVRRPRTVDRNESEECEELDETSFRGLMKKRGGKYVAGIHLCNVRITSRSVDLQTGLDILSVLASAKARHPFLEELQGALEDAAEEQGQRLSEMGFLVRSDRAIALFFSPDWLFLHWNGARSIGLTWFEGQSTGIQGFHPEYHWGFL